MTVDVPVTLHPSIEAAENQLRQFRSEVRTLAIRGYRDGDWSLEEMNTSLRRLELEPHTPHTHTRSQVLIRFALLRDGGDDLAAESRLRALARNDDLLDALRRALAELTDRHVDDDFALDTDSVTLIPDYTTIMED